MAALVWGAWGAEWAQNKKVAFNGLARTITVNDDVTALNLQTDVWSRWVDWAALPGNDYHTLAMRRTGYDAIPGGRSGLIYFLQNGWKLIVDLNRVRVSGVLYSDDFETAYWSADGQPIYPATVAALVNNVVSYQNVVTGDLSSVPTAAVVADQVRVALAAELARIMELAKIHGLVQGAPLEVSQNLRVAGDITQQISEAGGVTSVSRLS